MKEISMHPHGREVWAKISRKVGTYTKSDQRSVEKEGTHTQVSMDIDH